MIRLIFSLFLLPVVIFATREQSTIYAFWDEEGYKKTKMIVIGETVTFKKAAVTEFKSSLDLAVDTRPDVVTVKLHHSEGIRPGQTLYLIEKGFDHKKDNQGNIVGQIIVKSVFETTFFGTQLRGEGYLRMMDGRVMIVAKPVASDRGTDSYLTAKDADFFLARGNIEKSITLYKQAIDLDPQSPANHYALAKIHLRGGEGFVSAGYEYSLAWKYRQQFNSKNSELEFYSDYMDYLINRASKDKFKQIKYLEKTVNIYNSASKIKKSFKILNYGALANALLSREQERVLRGSAKRKKQEELLEKASDLIAQSARLYPHNYKLHEVSVIVNYEILRSLYYQNTMSPDGQKLKDKIIFHGKHYKSLKPSNISYSHEVEKILNIIN